MKILFIAVDMQKDFMDRDGKLYVQGSEEIKNNIKDLSKKMDKLATHIFYTMDWHEENDPEFSDNPDFIKTFPPHCIAGTRGAWLIPESIVGNIYPNDDNNLDNRVLIFHKNKFSVFEGSNLFLDTLNAYAYFDRIYVSGVSGNICVKHVIDGLLEHRGKEFDFGTMYIVEDCIASINPDTFNTYLTNLMLEYDFIKVIKKDSI